MSHSILSLRERWDQLKTEQARLRIRNAAASLGVSEVELLVTQCGENVTRLKAGFNQILTQVEKLGKVMALSRNDDVVHERKGVYLNPSLDNPHVGLFVGADIDLRIFFQAWGSAFAVEEMMGKAGEEKARRSLQFFAKDGTAIHKIYLTADSDVEAYHHLVAEFTHPDQSQTQAVTASAPASPEIEDKEVDLASFQEGWRNLKDTHDFFGLLKKHTLSRTQALRLAPEGDYAIPLGNAALRAVVSKAAEKSVPIMVFVGNPGIIQIHTGPVKKLLDHEDWFNVMDPDFNLHVRESAIAQSWIVRKPTEDGGVTALECFDKQGKQIVQLFGKRKPGIPELEEWRAIIKEVEQDLAS